MQTEETSQTGEVSSSSAQSDSLCIHCGTPTTDSNREFTEAQEGPFCCNGCKRVYQLLHEIELDHFYRLRKPGEYRGAIPAYQKVPDFSYLNEESFCHDYVRSLSPESSEITFFIEGIHCTACIWLLEQLPMLSSSVSSARLDYSSSALTIQFKTSEKLSEIAKTIASLGYHPRALKEDQLEEAYRQESRRLLYKLGVAAVSAGNTMMIAISLYEGAFSGMERKYLSFFTAFSAVIALPAILYSAQPFYKAAIAGLKRGRAHVDLPISIGVIGGYLLSLHSTITGKDTIYFDSITILIFLMLAARLIQRAALKKAALTRRSLEGFLPQSTTLLLREQQKETYIESLEPGDRILIKSAERIPADSRLASEKAEIDTSALTGESHSVRAHKGDLLYAGTLNRGDDIILDVEKSPRESRIQSFFEKSKAQTKARTSLVSIETISQYFVLGVLLFSGSSFLYWYSVSGIEEALRITLAFLVVTCPCALGLSTPLLLSRAVGDAVKKGIFISDPVNLEQITAAKKVFFDKTGTLTESGSMEFSLVRVEGEELSLAIDSELSSQIPIILSLESESDHPIAIALRNQFGERFTPVDILNRRAEREGISGELSDGTEVKIGSRRFVGATLKLKREEKDLLKDGVLYYRSADKLYLLPFSEKYDPSSKKLLRYLREKRKKYGIFSGDSESAVRGIGKQLGIPENALGYELTPEDKANEVESFKGESIVVGDGANDVLAFQKASVGVGIRGGAEQLLTTAGIYIQSGALSDVVLLFKGAYKTRYTLHGCYLFALLYNSLAGSFAIAGYITPLLAAILMPLSSLTVILIATFADPFPRGSETSKRDKQE